MGEWVSGCVGGWVGGWVSEWVSELMCVSELVCVKKRKYARAYNDYVHVHMCPTRG